MDRLLLVLNLNHVEIPVDHFEHIQQESMAPHTAISTYQLIDPNMSLDPKFLVPIEETVGSDPTQSTYLSDKDIDPSLVLLSTKDTNDSLMKTEEFLDFVDDLSQELSPSSDRELHVKVKLSLLINFTIIGF